MLAGRSWFLEGWASDSSAAWRHAIAPLPFRIGRRADLELALSSTMVSKLHAEIYEDDGRLMVRDLGSTNGTLLNLEPVTTTAPLNEGDLLHIADQECRLVSVKLEEEPTATLMSDMSGLRKLEKAAPEMKKLLERRAVTALFQPIVAPDQRVLGYEQLGRGNWSNLPASPIELFAIAERMEVEMDLSATLRLEGLKEAAALQGDSLVFVNTHPTEILRPHALIASLEQATAVRDGANLALEIHEMAVGDVNDFRPLREALPSLGIRLAFDDFGAGQARFLELAELSPHFVKFDRRLVHQIDRASPKRLELIRGLIRTVTDLGIKTVAEGIETADEAEICDALGFDYSQGYFHGRPAAASTFAPSAIGAG